VILTFYPAATDRVCSQDMTHRISVWISTKSGPSEPQG